jgi:flagellar motility protein MotE (MotC chaperone)
MRPAAARALRLGALAMAFAVAGTIALAQQTWEPTVSADPAKANTPAAMQVPKAKPPLAAEAAKTETPQPEAKSAPAKGPPAAPAKKGEKGAAEAAPASEYCVNIASAAADARFAWQKKAIADMEQEIAKRLALLEEKTAELQKWVERRDEFSKRASDTVLRIYQRMRPDAAALQLAALDQETAASVLIRLEPRVASLILNDMEPGQAARLTSIITASGKAAPRGAAKAAAQASAKEERP